MSAKNEAPIIIKRKKVISGDGHHGGAWKVAYADFVTAMMAFFLLMWLLNATTEKQRKGLADYFNPTIPVNRISGGGDGAFGGDNIFTEETLAQNGSGGSAPTLKEAMETEEQNKMNAEAYSTVEDALSSYSGESLVADAALQHIVTKVTDEGLVIEVFDLDEEPLFEGLTDMPTNVANVAFEMIATAVGLVGNDIAISAHVQSPPIVMKEYSLWTLSSDRADQTRRRLTNYGVQKDRIARVTGNADQENAMDNPLAARNNRIDDERTFWVSSIRKALP